MTGYLIQLKWFYRQGLNNWFIDERTCMKLIILFSGMDIRTTKTIGFFDISDYCLKAIKKR
jgi:hypothetical protein